MLKNKKFEPHNAVDLMPRATRFHISDLLNTALMETWRYRIDLGIGVTYAPTDKLIFMVFNQIGVVRFINVFDVITQTINVPLLGVDRTQLQVIAFISSVRGNKRYLSECQFIGEQTMKYSLTEQRTGDFWLDGRPIYQKTYTTTIPNTASGTAFYASLILPAPGTLLKTEGFVEGTIMTQAQYMFPTVIQDMTPTQPNTSIINIAHRPTTTELFIGIMAMQSSNINDMRGAVITVTAWYTKSTDAPEV